MSHSSKSSALERVAAGDAAAVREVIDRYGDLVWSLARRFTGSDADAEEAVQDIFVLLWRKAHHFDREAGAEATFVSVLARRLLIDRWRRSRRRVETTELRGPVAGGDRSGGVERDELASRAAAAFGELEAEAQLALRLSIEFGCSHGEIAEITGTPLGTVKTRIRTGLRTIRDSLKRESVSGVVR